MSDYHWTANNQRTFLEALAETGSVELACKEVSMSRRAAYNLRGRREGAAFKIGWDAALLQANAVVWGTLMDRAINGQMIETVRDPQTHTTRRMQFNGQMGLALLARLDAKAKQSDAAGPYETAVRMVDSDFAAFLDLIEAGATGAQAGLFVAARITPEERVFPGILDALENVRNQCELAQISSGCDDDEDSAKCTNDDTEEMTVWYDDERQGWRTNFPPPPGFDEDEEEGLFGDADYERDLSLAEAEAMEAKRAIEMAPLAEAGAVARDSFFGFVPAAVEVKSTGTAPVPTPKQPEPAVVPATDAIVDVQAVEPVPVTEPAPTPRTIHCKPQPNYAAMGMIPPWAERIY